jgi:transposase
VASVARRPGSDLGRPIVDWEAAFAHYAALPPETRSYKAVSAEFGVSVRTVERRGRLGRWRERVRGIEAQAAAEGDRQRGQARAEQLADVEKLIQASFVQYAQQLRSGDVRISATDLGRLFNLLQQLWGEPDPPSAASVSVERRSEDPPSKARSVEHKLEVVRALHDSGALTALADAAQVAGAANRGAVAEEQAL